MTKNALGLWVMLVAATLTAWLTESKWWTTAILLAVQTATLILGLLPVLGPSLPESLLQMSVVLAVTVSKLSLTGDLLKTAVVFAYMMFLWVCAIFIDMIWECL
jgi:hypothetical protein